MSDAGLQDSLTQWYIDDNPISLTFTRDTLTGDGEGGWEKTSDAPIGPFQVRLVTVHRISGAAERNTEDGSVAIIDYTIVAKAGTDIRRGDKFMHEGKRYRVVFVKHIQNWSVEAEATQHGA